MGKIIDINFKSKRLNFTYDETDGVARDHHGMRIENAIHIKQLDIELQKAMRSIRLMNIPKQDEDLIYESLCRILMAVARY